MHNYLQLILITILNIFFMNMYDTQNIFIRTICFTRPHDSKPQE